VSWGKRGEEIVEAGSWELSWMNMSGSRLHEVVRCDYSFTFDASILTCGLPWRFALR